MNNNYPVLVLLSVFLVLAKAGNADLAPEDSVKYPISVQSNEPWRLNLALPDGGLMPSPGILNLQLFRASRDAADLTDGDGWTYAHHMDLAVWKGKMYAAWNMTLKDEDRLPSKVVYATSADGVTWSGPADLFPREWAWACRFYFYLSRNHRMLTFCAAKTTSDGKVSEDKKSVLLVREILSDHTLGKVYTLISPLQGMPPFFETSPDKEFVKACRDAVSNNVLLEQQDYGVFLGDRKMEWHEKAAPYKGFYKFGKAFCFYHRADGKLVGISKMGFVTLSDDEGKTWTKPELPPSLTAGSAKVWGQKTIDGHYLLAYNPDPQKGKRYPLVLVQGEDGIHFRSMQVIHGEFSPLRYPGLYKDLGYQYVRGIPEWSNDHSLDHLNATWLIYSVNKEDIWISRIPVQEAVRQSDNDMSTFQSDPTGSVVRGWNSYSPKWAPVVVAEEPGNPANKCLLLSDRDPVDHAQAQWIKEIPNTFRVKFRVRPMQADGYLEASLEERTGIPSLRVVLEENGLVYAVTAGGKTPLGKFTPGQWLTVEARAADHHFTITLEGESSFSVTIKQENQADLNRFSVRTGKRFGLLDQFSLPVGSDRPLTNGSAFYLDDVSISN